MVFSIPNHFLYLHCIFNPKPRFDAFCDSNLSLSECCTPKSIGLSMFVIGFPEYKWPCVFCIPHFHTSPKKVSLNDFPGHPEVPPCLRCRSQRGGCADRYADRDPAEATATAPGYFQPSALKQALKQWGFRPSRFNMKFLYLLRTL